MRLKLHHPERILNDHQMRLADAQGYMSHIMDQKLRDKKHWLAYLSGQLYGLSPLKKLSSGFGFVTDQSGRRVDTVEKLEEGQVMKVQLADGQVTAQVLQVERLCRQSNDTGVLS